MTIFNTLFVLNLMLVALALLRMRPTALVFALNQAQTLRALDGIQAYGQPSSAAFLPSLVFAPPNLDIAWKIFAIATLLLGISLLMSPRSASKTRPSFPALPSWAAILLAVFLLLLTFSSGSLWDHAYDNESGSIFGVSFGGLNALMFSLLLYEAARRALLGTWKPLNAFLLVAVVMLLTCYIKGSTGLATGYLIRAAVVVWPADVTWIGRRMLLTLSLLAGITLTAFVVRSTRTYFYEDGFSSVTRVLETSDSREADRSRAGEGIEVSSNGTQYACHVLECAQLYRSGVSRHWASIYNPLIFTFEPSFLLAPLGITRPLDAPWELGAYFNHGGGIYLLGELYWNGGYFCLTLVFGLLVVLAFFCDTRFRTSAFWFMLCMQFAPNAFMGVGYGFAQVSRGLINGILVIGIFSVLPRVHLRSKLNSPFPLSRHRIRIPQ